MERRVTYPRPVRARGDNQCEVTGCRIIGQAEVVAAGGQHRFCAPHARLVLQVVQRVRRAGCPEMAEARDVLP